MGEAVVPRAVFEGLLAALRAMGRAAAADILEREFAARAWDLRSEDQLRLLEALRPDAPQPTMAEVGTAAPAPVPAETTAPLPDSWPEPLRHHAPFLRSIREGRVVLDAVGRLTRGRGWEEVQAAVRHMFVDVLGFAADEVDLLPRMVGRSQIGRFTAVARHGAFVVALVELTDELSDTRWSAASAHYAACFKLAPHALLVAIEPTTGTLRLVYQQTRRGDTSRPRYRALVGPWFFRDPHDDLVVWARRFDLLRPRFGEEHLELRARTEEVLDCPPRQLASEWASAPISTEETPPGLPFGSAGMVTRIESFLQEKAPSSARLVWGLEAALRQVFPAPLVRGHARLECDGYTLEPVSRSADDCWRIGRTLDRTLRLHLRPIGWHGEMVAGATFDIVASVPVPEAAGRFLVDGQLRVHRPQIDLDGRLVPDVTKAEEADDAEDGLGDDAALEGAEVTVEESGFRFPPGTGAFDVALQRAIEQRLGQHLRALRAALRRLEPPDPRDPEIGRYIRAALTLRLDEEGRLPLVARSWLRRHLAPVEFGPPEPSEARCDGVPHHPPAWACPERSSPTDGRWVAVSAARVHPCGAVVVPATRGGAVRLAVEDGSAFDLNPRHGGSGPGPRAWWIAAELIPWADCPRGLHRPADLAVAVPLPAGIVVRSTALPRDSAWVRPAVRPRVPERIRLAVSVAGRSNVDEAPKLLLSPGATADGTTPWVMIPWELVAWHLPPQVPLVDEVMGGLAPDGTYVAPLPGFTHRLPGGRWHVLAAGLELAHFPFGAPGGWRAWIELVREDVGPTTLVDDQGRWYRLVDRPDDIPWDGETGDEPDVVLGAADAEVEPDLPWFSGADGEVSATRAEPRRVHWLPRTAPVRDTEPRGRRLLSAEPLVARGIARCEYREWAVLQPAYVAAGATMDPSVLGPTGALIQSARALLAAAAPLPLGVFPVEWTASPQERLTERVPLRDEVATESGVVRFRPRARNRWRSAALVATVCSCGERRGDRWLGARCPACGDVVRERITDLGPMPAVALPWPVVHPWRKDLAGALLGLTEGEFDEVLTAWGPVHLRSALLAALGDPFTSGHRRLQNADGARLDTRDRRTLGLSLERLRRRLHVDPRLDGLWVPLLVVPAPELMPTGLILGTPVPVASPLALALQGVRRALMAARDLGREYSPVVRRATHVAVQHAVDGLFGSALDPAGWGTLAGILAATWPWMRPGHERIAVAGLEHLGGEPVDDPEAGRDDVFAANQDSEAPAGASQAARPDFLGEPRAVPGPQAQRETVRRLFRAAAGRDHVWRRILAMRHSPSDGREWSVDDVELRDLLSVMSDGDLRRAHQVLGTRCDGASSREDLIAAALESGSHLIEWVPRSRPSEPTPSESEEPSVVSTWVRASLSSTTTAALRLPSAWGFLPPTTLPVSWPAERARSLVRRRWWPWLAAVIDHVGASRPPLEGVSAGDVALAGLARALRDGRPGLVGLAQLLELGRPVPLPQRPDEARSVVVERLAGLDDGSMASRVLTELLAEAWAGWCLGEPTAEVPVGVVWSPGDTPHGTRRTLLGSDHPSWLTWPGVVLVSRPAWFVDEAEVTGWTPRAALLRWVGWRGLPTPDLEWALSSTAVAEPFETGPGEAFVRVDDDRIESASSVMSTDSGEPAAESLSEVASEPPDPPMMKEAPAVDIRWTDESVASWLRRFTTRGGP